MDLVVIVYQSTSQERFHEDIKEIRRIWIDVNRFSHLSKSLCYVFLSVEQNRSLGQVYKGLVQLCVWEQWRVTIFLHYFR
uniref:Uncharacterized protein n=1 Tax=Helianthus annuus TaxID=4232 RepID=A0A251UMA4_HELAN